MDRRVCQAQCFLEGEDIQLWFANDKRKRTTAHDSIEQFSTKMKVSTSLYVIVFRSSITTGIKETPRLSFGHRWRLHGWMGRQPVIQPYTCQRLETINNKDVNMKKAECITELKVKLTEWLHCEWDQQIDRYFVYCAKRDALYTLWAIKTCQFVFVHSFGVFGATVSLSYPWKHNEYSIYLIARWCHNCVTSRVTKLWPRQCVTLTFAERNRLSLSLSGNNPLSAN